MKKIHDVFLYIVISTCYTDEEIAKMVGSENCIKRMNIEFLCKIKIEGVKRWNVIMK